MSKGFTAKQRQKIHAHGHRVRNRLLGKQDDAADKYVFMQQCVSELVDSGEADDDGSARDICEMLWEEGSDLGDFGD